MATDLRNIVAAWSTDAQFRAWGQAIHDQIAAMGLVQTADTGQIDWTTVLKPAGNGATMGYEVWRFNDALQATKPVFIKINYRASQTISSSGGFNFQVSTGTDGAGTPTGQVRPTQVIYPGSSKGAGTLLPSYCSGSPSRLNLCTTFDLASPTFSVTLMVERTRTVDGVETGDGIVVFGICGGTSGGYSVVPYTGAVPGSVAAAMALTTAFGYSSEKQNVALSPTLAALGKPLFASWCAYVPSDIGELVPFTAKNLGANHTFLPLGAGLGGSTSAMVQGGSGHSMAMLWE